MFCKHDWKVLSETVSTSPLKELRDNGISPKSATAGEMVELTTRKHVCIVACCKCGKLKHMKTYL
jgi:hypothetical protein